MSKYLTTAEALGQFQRELVNEGIAAEETVDRLVLEAHRTLMRLEGLSVRDPQEGKPAACCHCRAFR